MCNMCIYIYIYIYTHVTQLNNVVYAMHVVHIRRWRRCILPIRKRNLRMDVDNGKRLQIPCFVVLS